MGYFEAKVTIVTGGASGLGRALCFELAKRGALVVVVDIDQEGAMMVADKIVASGGKATFAYLDVTIFENAKRIITDIAKKYGSVDLVINNAGSAIQGETRDLEVKHWRNIIDINLMGVIYGAISAYSYMEKRGAGQIVNISSLAGLIPVPNEIPYCTSKWAVVGFTNSLRLEGVGLGIKVNLVCPGIMQTPIYDNMPLVNIKKDSLPQPKIIKYFMTPDRAAIKILSGVERNSEIIIFPLYARLVWWLYRLAPAIFQIFYSKIIRDFRKNRIVR